MSVVVFAWGNEARGDDGLGPALGAHIEERWPEVALVTDYQLQLEHALDLKDRAMALFIDAGRGTEAPYRFYTTEPKPGVAHTSHALSPESLLDVAARVGVAAPPAFVLCIAGESFELGEPMSAAALGHLVEATALVDRLLAEPELEVWRALAESETKDDMLDLTE